MSKAKSDGIEAVTVAFGPRLAQSDHFNSLFREGMALVERTAAYLDGDGRKEARNLKAPVSVVYATESMRLTTRLLELASWLLIRRALNEGEITAEEAALKRAKVKLRMQGRPEHIGHYAELPEGLRQLIEESFRLTDRVALLDRTISPTPGEPPARVDNPVARHVAHLQAAFTQGARVIPLGRKV